MIGSVVGGYRIVGMLGAGGMGVVYVAEHQLIGRKAAVKVLLPELSNNREVVQRFFNEARASALIRHPGIVDIFDFGYMPDGSAYIAMEYLDGESLGGRLRRVGPLPEEQVLLLARQTAGALAAAHDKGIVHRDLKPDNISLVADSEMTGGERVKVLDFGIAKLNFEGAVTKTRTGSVMGSPLYMSPEQAKGAGTVDERSDIYSLGCVIFEMAAGRPPFYAEGSGEIIGMHIYEAPPLLRSMARVSQGLEALVARCLAKRPEDRFATMMDVVADLDRRLGRPATASGGPGRGAISFPPGPGGSRTTLGTSTGEMAAAGGDDLRVPKNKWRWVAVLGGLALVGAVVAAVLATSGDRTTESAAAEPAPAGGERTAPAKSEPAPAPEAAPASKPAPTVPAPASKPAPETAAPAPASKPAPETAAAATASKPAAETAAAATASKPAAETAAAAPATKPAPETAAAPVRPGTHAGAVAAPAVVRTTVSVTSKPPGATVVRAGDGVVLGKTPLEIPLPGASVELIIRLDGYLERTLTVGPKNASPAAVVLRRAQRPATAPPAAEPGHHRAKGEPLDPYAQ